MKIIISPAKEMNTNNPVSIDWKISDTTKKLVDLLQSMTPYELKNTLKINDSILNINQQYIENFSQTRTYKAIDMYHGLAYRWMDLGEFSEDNYRYLKEHLVILSSFYGPINPMDLVKPYRLDFTMPVKLEGKSLKNIWSPIYNSYFKDGETILNLASDEFSDLINKEKYRWIDFAFVELTDGKEKRHSTISKKARGRMVKYLSMNNIEDLNGVKKFNLDGYSYNSKKSRDNYLHFERKKV